MVSPHQRIMSEGYLSVLSDQMYPMFVESFPEENAIYRGDNGPFHKAEVVTE